ncbi:MAG TPA: DUF6600 domain-containing protein [Thermoanaerobaculia bacterium]|nr:DUF6600 domain-containing protein [Thermoanaerobaculia bacterium]
MRKLAFLFTLAITAALPAFAAQQGRAQSYFTYDDGGTIIHQGDDNREVEARVNLPVFPGDEVVTNRRGRSEIRLSDGNVLGLDRATAVRFKSILDSYDGDASQTTIDLKLGHVIVHRTEVGQDVVRLDTDNASYVAQDAAVYAVETDNGKDRVTVFDGAVEVRTPTRRSRLRAGEEAQVDPQGVYGLVSNDRVVADEFEKWFLRRSERYDRGNSKYLDSSLAYADPDLDANGSWIFVSNYGWAWRPYVAVGWRPYYHGSWVNGPSGCLVWVSDEAWGWVPYHYGRWAYDPSYGWFWMPGSGYAPAWVYWMYGDNYVGWVPAGWYECYRPYYNWCYRPYSRARLDFGFGFYGRVRVSELDLRPWTFITPDGLVSRRVDRAALTIDAVRTRLSRDGGSATVSNTGARFTRDQLKDPANAVHEVIRRGLGGGTGNEGSGSSADVTPFFRRDPDLSNSVRERITRNRPSDGGAVVSGGGSVAPIGRGSVAPIPSGGSVAPIGPAIGSVAPIGRGNVAPIGGGSIPRDTVHRNPEQGNGNGSDWRQQGSGARVISPVEPPVTSITPAAPSSGNPPDAVNRDNGGSWRGRAVRGGSGTGASGNETPAQTPPANSGTGNNNGNSGNSGSDVPRRVIDRIGGARIFSGDRGSSRNSGDSPSHNSPPPPKVERSSPPPEHHNPPPPPPPPPPAPHNDGGGSHNNNSGNHNSGDSGHVHRDHQ